jgi:hypothetical protein
MAGIASTLLRCSLTSLRKGIAADQEVEKPNVGHVPGEGKRFGTGCMQIGLYPVNDPDTLPTGGRPPQIRWQTPFIVYFIYSCTDDGDDDQAALSSSSRSG